MSEPLYVPKGTRDPHATSLIYEECGACEETGQNCPDHRYMQPEAAANGPSPTPPGGRENRLLRASGWARSAAEKDDGGGLMEISGSLLADLLDAVAHGTPLPITRAANVLARSLLGEPEVDRG